MLHLEMLSPLTLVLIHSDTEFQQQAVLWGTKKKERENKNPSSLLALPYLS